jgi:hypothetical protein
MSGQTQTAGENRKVRNTPAMYAPSEARALRQQYLSEDASPTCPRCNSEMDVETGFKARFLVTELSCTTCHRCVMFRPDRDTLG